MTGYHEIKVFAFPLPLGDEPLNLEENWKPFSSTIESNRLLVVCRKWHRAENRQGYAHEMGTFPIMVK